VLLALVYYIGGYVEIKEAPHIDDMETATPDVTANEC
jgi:hypothetical protein